MKTLLCLVLSGLAFTAINWSNLCAQSPGDTIGYTEYVYQCNGSTGRRVVLDNSGGLHFAWMWSDHYGVTRNVRYNCFGPTFPSPWQGEGVNVAYRAGSGYCQIDIASDDRAVIAYHNATTSAESLYAAKDIFQCQGTFFTGHPPNRIGSNKLAWPHLTVDRNNRIHVVATSNSFDSHMPIGYTRSNTGGSTWTAIAPVDTSGVISAIVVSSKVSDKVAMLYCHPKAGDTTSLRNDIYYIESPDGITWNNFADKVNISNYGLNGDSLYAWNEVSAVYDFNDDLHVIWNAQYVTNTQFPHLIISGAHLAHWDQVSNTISYFTDFPPSWPDSTCDFTPGNFVFAQSSIAVDSVNNLYVAYTSWDSTDCAADSQANGDIYFHRSVDGGATWSPKENLTNSRSPGCLNGNCRSDLDPSLAEISSQVVHLLYICNVSPDLFLDPVNYNPVLYLAIPKEPLSANDARPLPAGYSLTQNYPNPFNAQTSIKFYLPERSHIKLSIYNILGEESSILLNGFCEAGEHDIIWDANGFPSGVYFARLQIEEKGQSIRMLLIK